MLAAIGLVATVCENRVYNASAEQEHEMILYARDLRGDDSCTERSVARVVFSYRLLATILVILLIQKHPQYVEPS